MSTNVEEQIASPNDAKPNISRSLLVIGIATSGDVETWRFDDDMLCRQFCEQLARNTGRSVIVVEGKEVGKYSLQMPVVYLENDR